MKIKFKSDNPKNEYDELLEVIDKARLIIKNPKKKVKLHTKMLIKNIVLCVLCIPLYFALVMLDSNNIFHLILMGVILISIVTLILMLVSTNKKINTYIENARECTLEVLDEKVIFNDKNKKLEFKWDEIKYIVVNKYSICFIPYTLPNLVVSVPVSVKEELMKSLIKLNKIEKLIDNSDMYK